MIDIIILLIILGTACLAARAGFIKTVYGLLSSLIALVLAFFIYPVIEAILKLTPIYDGIRSWMMDRLPEIGSIGLQGQAAIIQGSLGWMPDFITDKIVRNNNPEIYQLLGVNSLIEYMATFVADLCIMGIAVVICFIFVRVGLAIGVGVLDLVAKLPILKTANKWAGFIVGLIKGVLIVWLICLIVPFMMMIPGLDALNTLIEESVLMQLFYNHNIILQVITNLKA